MAKRDNKSNAIFGKVLVISTSAAIGALVGFQVFQTVKSNYIPAKEYKGSTEFDVNKSVSIVVYNADLHYKTKVGSTTTFGQQHLHKEPDSNMALLMRVEQGTTYAELIRGIHETNPETGVAYPDGYGLKVEKISGSSKVTPNGFYLRRSTGNGEQLIDLEFNKDYKFTEIGVPYVLIPRYEYNIDFAISTSTGESININQFGNLSEYINDFNKKTYYPIVLNSNKITGSIKAVENLQVTLPTFSEESYTSTTYKIDLNSNTEKAKSGYFRNDSTDPIRQKVTVDDSKYYAFTRKTSTTTNNTEFDDKHEKLNLVFHIRKTYKYASDESVPEYTAPTKKYEFIGLVGDTTTQTDALYGLDASGNYLRFGTKVISGWTLKSDNAEDTPIDIGLPGSTIQYVIDSAASQISNFKSTNLTFVPRFAESDTYKTIVLEVGNRNVTGVINDIYSVSGNAQFTVYEGGTINLDNEYYSPVSLFDSSVNSGYKFAGWYKDENFTQPVSGNLTYDELSSTTTLYAKWTYDVNYVNDASDDMAGLEINEDISIGKDSKVFTATGVLSYQASSNPSVTVGGDDVNAIVLATPTLSENNNGKFKFLGWTAIPVETLASDDLFYSPTMTTNLRRVLVEAGQIYNGKKFANLNLNEFDRSNLNLYAIWTYNINYKVIDSKNNTLSSTSVDPTGIENSDVYANKNYRYEAVVKQDNTINTYSYVYARHCSYMSNQVKGITNRVYLNGLDHNYKFTSWKSLDGSKEYDSSNLIDATLGNQSLIANFEYEVRYYLGEDDGATTYNMNVAGYERHVEEDTNYVYYSKSTSYDYDNLDNNKFKLEVTDASVFIKAQENAGKYYDIQILNNFCDFRSSFEDDSVSLVPSNYDPDRGILSPSEISLDSYGIVKLFANWNVRALGLQIEFAKPEILDSFGYKYKVEWNDPETQFAKAHPIVGNSVSAEAGFTFTSANLSNLKFSVVDKDDNEVYNFAGLYRDINYTTQVDSFTVNSNLASNIVYPKFEYTITLNTRGGTFADNTTTNRTFDFVVGQDKTVNTPSCKHSNYSFDSYYSIENDSFTTDEVVVGDNVSLADGRGNKTYYARYGIQLTLPFATNVTEDDFKYGSTLKYISSDIVSDDGRTTNVVKFNAGYQIVNNKLIYTAEAMFDGTNLVGLGEYLLPNIQYVNDKYTLEGYYISSNPNANFDYTNKNQFKAVGTDVKDLVNTQNYVYPVFTYTLNVKYVDLEGEDLVEKEHTTNYTQVLGKSISINTNLLTLEGATTLEGIYSSASISSDKKYVSFQNKLINPGDVTYTDDGTGNRDVFARFGNYIKITSNETINTGSSNLLVDNSLDSYKVDYEGTTLNNLNVFINKGEKVSFIHNTYTALNDRLTVDGRIGLQNVGNYTFEGFIYNTEASKNGYVNVVDHNDMLVTDLNLTGDVDLYAIYTYRISLVHETGIDYQYGVKNKTFNFNGVKNPTQVNKEYIFAGYQAKVGNSFVDNSKSYGNALGYGDIQYKVNVDILGDTDYIYNDDGITGDLTLYPRYAVLIESDKAIDKTILSFEKSVNLSNGHYGYVLYTDKVDGTYTFLNEYTGANKVFAGYQYDMFGTTFYLHTGDVLNLSSLKYSVTYNEATDVSKSIKLKVKLMSIDDSEVEKLYTYSNDGSAINGLTLLGQNLEEIVIPNTIMGGSAKVTTISSGAFRNAYSKLNKFDISNSSVTTLGSLPYSTLDTYVVSIGDKLVNVEGDLFSNSTLTYKDLYLPVTVKNINITSLNTSSKVILSNDYTVRNLPKINSNINVDLYAGNKLVFNAVKSLVSFYKDSSKNYSSGLVDKFGYVDNSVFVSKDDIPSTDLVTITFNDLDASTTSWTILKDVDVLIKDTFTEKVLSSWVDSSTSDTYAPFVTASFSSSATLDSNELSSMDESYFTYEVTSEDEVTITGFRTEGEGSHSNISDLVTLILPSTLDGKKVIAVKENAFGVNDDSSIKYPNLKRVISVSNNSNITSIDGAFNSSNIESVDLTNLAALTSLGENAFSNMSMLNTLIVGDNVSGIASEFMVNCPSISDITVSVGNTFYKVEGNGLYTSEGTTLVKYFGQDTSYTVGKDTSFEGIVKNVLKGAFSSTKLVELVLPSTITSVAFGSFDINSELETIVLESNILNKFTNSIENFAKDNYQIITNDFDSYVNYKLSDTIFSQQVKDHIVNKDLTNPNIVSANVVIHNADGMNNLTIHTYVGANISLPDLSYDNHTLVGIYTDEACTNEASKVLYVSSANIDLYAKYEENEFTTSVTFQLSFSSTSYVKNVSSTYNSILTLSSDGLGISSTYFENLSHFVDDLGVRYEKDSVIRTDRNRVLSAVYFNSTSLVMFDANNGTLVNSTPTIVVNMNESFTLPDATSADSSSFLVGWLDIATNDLYKLGDTVVPSSKNVTLKAVYSSSYTATYNNILGELVRENGVVLSNSTSIDYDVIRNNFEVAFGNVLVLPNVITNSDATLTLWVDSNGNSYLPGESISLTNDLVLNAVYSNTSYSVNFTTTISSTNEGVLLGVDASSLIVDSGSKLVIPELVDIYNKDNRFLYWICNTLSSGIYEKYNKGETILVNSNINLIPVFESNSSDYASICIETNGGLFSSSTRTRVVNKGYEVDLSKLSCERKDKVFKGWSIDSGASIISDSKITINSDTTLSAVYDSYKYTYRIDDGELISVERGKFITLPDSSDVLYYLVTNPDNTTERFNKGESIKLYADGLVFTSVKSSATTYNLTIEMSNATYGAYISTSKENISINEVNSYSDPQSLTLPTITLSDTTKNRMFKHVGYRDKTTRAFYDINDKFNLANENVILEPVFIQADSASSSDANSFTVVTYVNNDGVLSTSKKIAVKQSELSSTKFSSVTDSSVEFKGWVNIETLHGLYTNESHNLSSDIADVSSKRHSSYVTYYAIYNKKVNLSYSHSTSIVNGTTPGIYDSYSEITLPQCSNNITSGTSFLYWEAIINNKTLRFAANDKVYLPFDVTFTAVYSDVTLASLKFVLNGSSLQDGYLTEYNYKNNTSTIVLPRAYKDNYQFIGWSTKQNSSSANLFAGNTYEIKTNTTLYAVFSILSYNVKVVTNTVNGDTITYNGSEISSSGIRVNRNSTLDLSKFVLNIAQGETRTGSITGFRVTDSLNNVSVIDNTGLFTVNSDITIEPIVTYDNIDEKAYLTYSVSDDYLMDESSTENMVKDETNSTSRKLVYEVSKYTSVVIKGISSSNVVLAYWRNVNNPSEKYYEGDTVYITSDLSLEPVFVSTSAEYKYVYDLDGGYFVDHRELSGYMNKSSIFKLPALSDVSTDKNKTLLGWYVVGLDEKYYSYSSGEAMEFSYVLESETPKYPVVIKAIWSNRSSSTVTLNYDYNNNDYTGSKANASVQYIGSTITLPTVDDFGDYTFIGWYNPEETNVIMHPSGSTTMIFSNVTYKALWAKNGESTKDYYSITYAVGHEKGTDISSVEFIMNDKKFTSDTPFYVSKDSKFTLENLISTDPHYKLLRIEVTSNGITTAYTYNDTIVITSDAEIKYVFADQFTTVRMDVTNRGNTVLYDNISIKSSQDDPSGELFSSNLNESPLVNQTVSIRQGDFSSSNMSLNVNFGNTFKLPSLADITVSDPGLVLKGFELSYLGKVSYYLPGTLLRLDNILDVVIKPILTQRTLSFAKGSDSKTQEFTLSDYTGFDNSYKYYSHNFTYPKLSNFSHDNTSEDSKYTEVVSEFKLSINSNEQTLRPSVGSAQTYFGCTIDENNNLVTYIDKEEADESTLTNVVTYDIVSTSLSSRVVSYESVYGDSSSTYGTFASCASSYKTPTDVVFSDTLSFGNPRIVSNNEKYVMNGFELYLGSTKLATKDKVFNLASGIGVIDKSLTEVLTTESRKQVYDSYVANGSVSEATISIHPRPVQYGSVNIEFEDGLFGENNWIKLKDEYKSFYKVSGTNSNVVVLDNYQMQASSSSSDVDKFFENPFELINKKENSSLAELVFYRVIGSSRTELTLDEVNSIELFGTINLEVGIICRDTTYSLVELEVITDDVTTKEFRIYKQGSEFDLSTYAGYKAYVSGTHDSSTTDSYELTNNKNGGISSAKYFVVGNTAETSFTTFKIVDNEAVKLKLTNINTEEDITRSASILVGRDVYDNSNYTFDKVDVKQISKNYQSTLPSKLSDIGLGVQTLYYAAPISVGEITGATDVVSNSVIEYSYEQLGPTQNSIVVPFGKISDSDYNNIINKTISQDLYFANVGLNDTKDDINNKDLTSDNVSLLASNQVVSDTNNFFLFGKSLTSKVTLSSRADTRGDSFSKVIDSKYSWTFESGDPRFDNGESSKKLGINRSLYQYVNVGYDEKVINLQEVVVKITDNTNPGSIYDGKISKIELRDSEDNIVRTIEGNSTSITRIHTKDINSNCVIYVEKNNEYTLSESTADAFDYEWVHNVTVNNKFYEWAVVATGLRSDYVYSDGMELRVGSIVSNSETVYSEMAGFPIVGLNKKVSGKMPVPYFVYDSFGSEEAVASHYNESLSNLLIIKGSSDKNSSLGELSSEESSPTSLVDSTGFANVNLIGVSTLIIDNGLVTGHEIGSSFFGNTSEDNLGNVKTVKINLPGVSDYLPSGFVSGHFVVDDLYWNMANYVGNSGYTHSQEMFMYVTASKLHFNLDKLNSLISYAPNSEFTVTNSLYTTITDNNDAESVAGLILPSSTLTVYNRENISSYSSAIVDESSFISDILATFKDIK